MYLEKASPVAPTLPPYVRTAALFEEPSERLRGRKAENTTFSDFSNKNAVKSCLVVRKVRAALPPNANTRADRAKGALAFPSSPPRNPGRGGRVKQSQT